MRGASLSSPPLVDILVSQLKGLVTAQGTYDTSPGRGVTDIVGGTGVGVGSVRAAEEGLVLLATLLGATGMGNNDISIPTSVPYVRMDMGGTGDMVMCCLSLYAHSPTAAGSSSGSNNSDQSDSYTSARVAWHGCVILAHLIQVADNAATTTTTGGEGSESGPTLSVRQLALGMKHSSIPNLTYPALPYSILLPNLTMLLMLFHRSVFEKFFGDDSSGMCDSCVVIPRNVSRRYTTG